MTAKDRLSEAARIYAQLLIDCGYYGRVAYEADVLKKFYEGVSESMLFQVKSELQELYDARLNEQKAWGKTSGEDFDEIFEELGFQDVTSHQFIGASSREARQYAVASAEDAWGYCYFTRRDALMLVTHNKIAVTFGLTKTEEAGPSRMEIGQDILDTFNGFDYKATRLFPFSARLTIWTPNWRRKLNPEATWPLLQNPSSQ